jgi:hypothetical protein
VRRSRSLPFLRGVLPTIQQMLCHAFNYPVSKAKRMKAKGIAGRNALDCQWAFQILHKMNVSIATLFLANLFVVSRLQYPQAQSQTKRLLQLP